MGNICCSNSKEATDIDYFDTERLDTLYSQAGGHDNTIVFEGERLTKITKESEVLTYQQIFDDDEQTSLTKLRPFVAEFYGTKKLEGGKKWSIELDNLLYGLENASFIDIKLGTSTLTQGKGRIKTVVRNKVDTDTTAKLLGFTMCGMTIKDHQTGNEISKVAKNQVPKDMDEAEEYLEHFFRCDGSYDYKAIEYVSNELKMMKHYFTKVNLHEIRGMSLFIAIDSVK